MDKLSNKLKDEIAIEINKKILQNYHVFSNHFSQKTINKLYLIMKEVLISPNQLIFKEEAVDDNAIYFIQSGNIEIFYQNMNR